MTIGDFIKNFRQEKDLTMQEFASRAGLSKGYVSMLENNKHPQSGHAVVPSIETCSKVANAVGISVDELIRLLGDKQLVNVSHPETSSSSLSKDEELLLGNYRELNERGQNRLIEESYLLKESEIYKKEQCDPVSKES